MHLGGRLMTCLVRTDPVFDLSIQKQVTGKRDKTEIKRKE